jgi:hypothetical protein
MNNSIFSPSTKQANSFLNNTPASRTLYSNWLSTSPTHYKTEQVEQHPATWTHTLQPCTGPTTCKPKVCMSYSLAYALKCHIAHTQLPFNLPAGYLPTDTSLSKQLLKNHILPLVMPTHYSHDIHHTLYIPIKDTPYTR